MIVLGDEPVACVGATCWHLAPRIAALSPGDPDRVCVERAAGVLLSWRARGGSPLLFLHLPRSAGRPADAAP